MTQKATALWQAARASLATSKHHSETLQQRARHWEEVADRTAAFTYHNTPSSCDSTWQLLESDASVQITGHLLVMGWIINQPVMGFISEAAPMTLSPYHPIRSAWITAEPRNARHIETTASQTCPRTAHAARKSPVGAVRTHKVRPVACCRRIGGSELIAAHQ